MTTSRFTRMNTNSHFVKRQILFPTMYRYSYGTNLTGTNPVIRCVQGHPRNENTIWHRNLKDSISLSIDGENYTELRDCAYEDYESCEIKKYALELMISKLREKSTFDDSDEFVHNDKLVELQVRLHESIERCKNIKENRTYIM